MEKEVLISVIIPVYNAEKYLRNCLDSVMNQTYKNLEIICVNDGSSDDSAKILEEYKDLGIKVISQENQGVSSARNNGLQNASGDYIFFLDADDTMEDKTIEILYSRIINEGTDIAISNFKLGKKVNYKFESGTIESGKILRDVLNCKSRMAPCWGMLISRKYIDIKFKNYRLCEDEFYTIELLHGAEKVSFESQCLITYRESESSKKDDDYYLDGFRAAEEYSQLIKRKKPELMEESKCRLLMHSFYAFFNSKDQDMKNQIKDVVRKNRSGVIKNREASTLIKVICLLSYLGMRFTSLVYNVYLSIKR